ncbi:Biotin synthase [Varanus komodoensis]|nr:Biotin synthase [Varanus komodoensis]
MPAAPSTGGTGAGRAFWSFLGTGESCSSRMLHCSRCCPEDCSQTTQACLPGTQGDLKGLSATALVPSHLEGSKTFCMELPGRQLGGSDYCRILPVLFNIFFKDLDEEVQGKIIKFADDTKLGGIANPPEDRMKIQCNLDKLEYWAQNNRMRFSKDKCQVLHQGKRDQMHRYKMVNMWLSRTENEKDLGINVNWLDMSQQHDAVAKKGQMLFLGCIKRSITSKLEYCVQFWALEV